MWQKTGTICNEVFSGIKSYIHQYFILL